MTGAPSSTRPATPSTTHTPRLTFRSRSGAWATTRSPRAGPCSSSTSSASRRGSTGASTCRVRATSLGECGRPCSTSCGATRRSCSTSWSSTPRRTRRRCAAGTSSCSPTRSRSSRARPTTSATSTPASTPSRTCALGLRGAAPGLPARGVRQRLVRSPRGRRAAARALVARPAADRRGAAPDVTGATLEMESVAEDPRGPARPPLERAACRGWRAGLERRLTAALSSEVVLDEHHVVP